MASTAMDYETANGDRFEEDGSRYDRDRSASPRRDDGRDDARDDGPPRRRSMSPPARDRAHPKDNGNPEDEEGAQNTGTNLFVTGINPKCTEMEVTRLFEKYGEVEKCQIMKDPHTGESRGFGFVNMMTSEQADAAKEGLQGQDFDGRVLSIEKARRSRPRTPTPGKYFGPPKRDGPGRGGRMGGRFDDRPRREGGYGGFRGDDRGYRGYREDRGYDRSYDRGYDRSYDRSYDRGYRGGEDRYERGEDRAYRGGGYDRRGGGDREDYSSSRFERYGGGREDRYTGARGGGSAAGGDDRRAAGYDRGDRYDRTADRDARPPRDAAPAAGGYSDSGPRPDAREPYGTR